MHTLRQEFAQQQQIYETSVSIPQQELQMEMNATVS